MSAGATGSVNATPFRWHDGERVIAFGPLDAALPLLGEAGYALLTTERARAAAPAVASGAAKCIWSRVGALTRSPPTCAGMSRASCWWRSAAGA